MNVKGECSISHWYPVFAKDALEARIVRIPEQVCKYLQHDTFILPAEASPDPPVDVKWTDGTTSNAETSEVSAILEVSRCNTSRIEYIELLDYSSFRILLLARASPASLNSVNVYSK